MEKICSTCWWFQEFPTQRRKDWYQADGMCLKKKVAKSACGYCSRWLSRADELIKRKEW